MNRSWKFEDENMVELNKKMTPSDRDNFTVSILEFSRSVDEYMENIANGSRKYFFNETEEDLKKALKKLKIFKMFHYILLFMIYTALFFFGYKILNQFSFSKTVGNFVTYMNGRSADFK